MDEKDVILKAELLLVELHYEEGRQQRSRDGELLTQIVPLMISSSEPKHGQGVIRLWGMVLRIQRMESVIIEIYQQCILWDLIVHEILP